MTAHVRRIVTVIAVLVQVPLFGPARTAHPEAAALASPDARAAFEKLQAIAGTWNFRSAEDHGTVSYELVSNGTAVLERVMTEEHGEAGMVSVIFVEGDRLVLQHYCGSGNQPRLISSGLDGDEIRFSFERGSNLASPDTGHIHRAVFAFAGTGPFASRWTWRENGAETTVTRLHTR